MENFTEEPAGSTHLTYFTLIVSAFGTGVIKVLHNIISLLNKHQRKSHIDGHTDRIVCGGDEGAGTNSRVYADSSEQKGQK